MSWRSVCLGVALSGFFVASQPAETKPITRKYDIDDLGTLGGTESFAYALNDRGDVVGLSRTEGDTTTHAFLFRDGALIDLAPLNSEDIETVGPTGINNRGQIASGIVDNGVYVPALTDTNRRRRGTLLLGSLGGVNFGFSGVATSVNDHGDAVGYAYVDSLNRHAFLFKDGLLTDIGSFGGYSVALRINDHDEIAGFSSDTPNGIAHAFVYRDGVMTEINPFGELSNESYGRGINKHGQVVGDALNSSAHAFNGFIYSDGEITNIGTLPGGRNSGAYSINDRGEVVGIADYPYVATCEDFETGQTFPCIQYAQHAVLYAHGVLKDLNLMIESDAGWDLQWAFDINQRGQIVGYGVRDGKARAYLMTPVKKHMPKSTN
jgi:probable HAF family extracellular repeat protein